jgi:hypothetical protein
VQIVAPDGLTPFNQADPNQTGWAGEISLDVEWAHAIAPAATIKLVLAKSNNDADILSATQYAVDNNLGDVISQSFGEAEECVDPAIERAQHQMFAKATLKGITLLASSGDQGAAQPSCDGTTFIKAASSPASDPFVTGVGGTLLDADGLTGAYHGETTWNEPEYEAATGGGFSRVYGTPLFQKQLGLPSRGVPDVAYNAGIGTGVLTVWSTSGFGPEPAVHLRRHQRRLPAVGRADRAGRAAPARAGRLPQPAGVRAVAGPAGLHRAVPRHHHRRQHLPRRDGWGSDDRGLPGRPRLGSGHRPRHAEGEQARPGARGPAAVTSGTAR